jgi:hypothetical protein
MDSAMVFAPSILPVLTVPVSVHIRNQKITKSHPIQINGRFQMAACFRLLS